MCGRRLPRWWVLPLEMLSTCTCYSRLHWRWFGYVSHFYCTTWPSLVLARFRFLLVQVSGPCCSICPFSIGTRVVLRLGHVLLLHWTTYRIIIGPHVRSYLTTRHDAVRPCVIFLYVHMAWWFSSTCWIFNSPCVMPWSIHVAYTGWSTCRIFIWSWGMSWFYYI